jgi:phosphoribosylformylglycinamidine cyclo-ligase
MIPVPREICREFLAAGYSVGLASFLRKELERKLVNFGFSPTYAVDYIGVGRLDPDIFGRIGQSFLQIENQIGFKIVGGEIAVMPSVYQEGEGEIIFWVDAQKGSGAPLSWNQAERFHVVSIDGVGTKSLLALECDLVEGLPYDIVHHCVNDLMSTGAAPTSFYAYLGKHPSVSTAVEKKLREGLATACHLQGLVFMGCVTEVKDDVYYPECIDLVGVISGEVAKSEILTGGAIAEGDVLVGLPSDGLHTNGYSLVRNVTEGLGFQRRYLLRPHRSYRDMIQKVSSDVKAVAHITGGGLYENVGRLLPKGLSADIRARRGTGRWIWPRPPEFALIDRLVEKQGASLYQFDFDARVEAFGVFNQGVGLVLVVSRENQNKVRRRLSDSYKIGEIVRSKGKDVVNILF